MLDELGNLQSEGHGISGFETMLSIGLGQEQQFTLILQTLQQLRDVYGDSVDKIVQGNTSNIVFLKSTDDSMLDTLQKMSGVRHRTYTDSKVVTQNKKSIAKMMQNEGMVSLTSTTKEEPVISYNDMAFISKQNSIVFRAGDSPIWNRNETILPMSWKLFENTIVQPGKTYSLQTIPTLSTAMDFDVRKNQPNFSKMLEKRMSQAYIANDAQKMYRDAYGYDDYAIEQLDPDVYSDDIMDLIYSELNPKEMKEAMELCAAGKKDSITDDEYEEMFDYIFGSQSDKSGRFTVEQDIYNEFDTIERNEDVMKMTAKFEDEAKSYGIKRYAGKQISRDMLVSRMGVNHGLDTVIISVYKSIRSKLERDDEYFRLVNGSLCGVDGTPFIRNLTASDDYKALNRDAKDENTRVYADTEITDDDINAIGSFAVTDAFLKFLVSFPGAWPFVDGEFDRLMKRAVLGEDDT